MDPIAANKPVKVPVNRSAAWWLAACGLLVIAIGVIFGQTLGHDFVNRDDGEFVYDNPHISGGLSAESIQWAFTDGPFHEWYPLAVLSHMLDCQIYGLWPGGHHLSSVIWHSVASVMLLISLVRMTGAFWPSMLVATLFAVHPLHVESVAWVAERRDVLSAACFMLMLWTYFSYVRRPSFWRYLMVALLLALGLMAKASLVPVPLVLLLLDYWPLARFEIVVRRRRALPAARWQLVAEKIPLLALSAGASAIEMSMHSRGYDPLTFGQKIGNALVTCVTYLGQFLYPVDLVAFYQHPGAGLPLWKPAAALVILAAITAATFIWRRRCPYLLVGWFWYLLMLAPALGLVQVGMHARADRYTYLSQIGLYIALAWGMADGVRCLMRYFGSKDVDAGASGNARSAAVAWGLGGAATLWIATLMVCSWRQTGTWRDTETLWRYTVAVAPSATAHFNRGDFLETKGHTDEAIDQYRAAVAIDPTVGPINDPVRVRAYTRLGDIKAGKGQWAEALDDYRQALKIAPNSSIPHNNLGLALQQQGNFAEAAAEYRRSVELEPSVPMYKFNLGNMLWRLGKLDQAAICYQQTLKLDPNLAAAKERLTRVLAEKDEKGPLGSIEARTRQALALDPRNAEAHNNLATILARQQRIDEAIEHYLQALAIQPNFAVAHNNLALVLAARGRTSEAIAHYQRALEIDPANSAARQNLDRLEAAQKN